MPRIYGHPGTLSRERAPQTPGICTSLAALIGMDAVTMLMADHRHIRALFDGARKASSFEVRRGFVDRIGEELERHMRVEETVLYPAFSAFESFENLLDDLYGEHQLIEDLLRSARHSLPDEIDDQLAELEETVEDHLGHEEREFFPRVKDVLTELDTRRIGGMIADAWSARPARAA